MPTPTKSENNTTWPKSDQSTRGADVTFYINVVSAYAATTVFTSTGSTGWPHTSFTFVALTTERRDR